MISQLKSLVFTETGKDTSVVFLGTLANIIVGGLFFVFAPRILEPADYGLFFTIISTGLMAATIANFGLDTGILRFATKKDLLNRILSLAFKTYLIFGTVTALIGLIIAPILADFLNQPQIGNLLRIAFSGTIFILLTNFFVAGLQAKGEFTKASIVNLSSNMTRLIILAAGSYFALIGLYFLTTLFFLVVVVSVIVGKIYLSFKFEKTQITLAREYFSYNIWIALALVISSIPFDNYLLLKLAGPLETGLYAAPFKLLTFSYQFGGNFSRVLAPRFASFDNDEKAKIFAKKSLIFPVMFSIALVFLIVFAQSLTVLLFGKNYTEAASVLRILSFGFIFFFLSTIPSSLILYYFGKSNISLLITVLRYVTFVILLSVLVPTYKSTGAAIAFTASEITAFFLMISYIFLKFQKSHEH